MKTLVSLSAVCLMTLSLSGCIARLLLLEESELFAIRRAATAGISDTSAAGSLLRATRMGITAEEISVLARSTATIRAGRLIAADEVAFNSQLGKIRLVRSVSQNPRLILRGASEPFAEVLPREGRIRLFNNNTISLHNDIYSAESDIVIVRRTPLIASNNVVATLRQGDLAVRLTERNGWYQVRVVQAGQELTGFIEARLLSPLVLLGSREDRKNRSPQQAIAGEEKQRWDYYCAAIGGNDVPEFTANDAMSILFHDFGMIGADRRVGYSATDWPIGVKSFLRVDSENLPILSSNTFKDKDLRIIGFTKAGEFLQYVSFSNEWVKLNNPLDWGPKNYGEWYQVRTLSGDEGWVFTKPYGQTYSSGTLVKRCEPGRIALKNASIDAYRIYVDGTLSFDLRGKTTQSVDNIPIGSHTLRGLQLGGYLFFPTDKTSRVNVTCGETISLVFP